MATPSRRTPRSLVSVAQTSEPAHAGEELRLLREDAGVRAEIERHYQRGRAGAR